MEHTEHQVYHCSHFFDVQFHGINTFAMICNQRHGPMPKLSLSRTDTEHFGKWTRPSFLENGVGMVRYLHIDKWVLFHAFFSCSIQFKQLVLSFGSVPYSSEAICTIVYLWNLNSFIRWEEALVLGQLAGWPIIIISLENNDRANFSILHPDCCFYMLFNYLETSFCNNELYLMKLPTLPCV